MCPGQRAMKDKVVDIRADIGAALLNEGEFNTPATGLTVFIRELSSDGHIRGVLAYDSRNAKRPIAYLAESGQLAQTPAGAIAVMIENPSVIKRPVVEVDGRVVAVGFVADEYAARFK